MKRDTGKKFSNITRAGTELAGDTKKTPQWTLQKTTKNRAIFITFFMKGDSKFKRGPATPALRLSSRKNNATEQKP